ncbi:MAG: aminotransferase class I/II-fold pyridoxal phosphate-dependent enzyme, partial [Methyloceanibacter sp.]|nr:aminotransferase class I/II-fold pyridoxal phosphate-dependent enzyme [Methyloceanibacter sp.]
IYAPAVPPPVLGAMVAALELAPGLHAARALVARLAAGFRAGAGAAGLNTGASTTQIVPIVVGTPEAALAMSGRLRQAGLWASSIRPPTVPPGTARLRLAFTAAHQETDVDRLLDVLAAERAPRRARAI